MVSTKIFDTYVDSKDFERFVGSQIPDGYIVVVACKDECTTALSNTGKGWFAGLGSKEIWKVGYREGFAFIGIQGKKTEVYEKRAMQKRDKVSVTQVFEQLSDGENQQLCKPPLGDTNLKLMLVQVYSAGYNAGNFAEIHIDGEQVLVANNEHNHQRGIHIVVINPHDGKIHSVNVFDTYRRSDKFD